MVLSRLQLQKLHKDGGRLIGPLWGIVEDIEQPPRVMTEVEITAAMGAAETWIREVDEWLKSNVPELAHHFALDGISPRAFKGDINVTRASFVQAHTQVGDIILMMGN